MDNEEEEEEILSLFNNEQVEEEDAESRLSLFNEGVSLFNEGFALFNKGVSLFSKGVSVDNGTGSSFLVGILTLDKVGDVTGMVASRQALVVGVWALGARREGLGEGGFEPL